MISNAQMFRLSEEIAHDNSTQEETRTMYVIQLRKTGVYLRAPLHWTYELNEAARFEHMTTALIYAFEILELGPEEFDVECVA